MSTSHYFNNFSTKYKSNEQRIYEDLLVESIKIMGHDVYYLPRESLEDVDLLFGENMQSKFERAYQMEMYIANVQGWEGDSEFFTKFGLEIRDTSNFVLALRTFRKYVPTSVAARPREGDLIFVPVMNKIFEIKFVEEELLFFAKGQKTPYIYELRCEAFRYSNEKIATGVEELDRIDNDMKYTVELSVTGNGNFIIGETVYQGSNLAYATATAKVSSWIPANNKLYIIESKGEFTTGNVTGVISTTRNVVTVADTLGDHVYYDLFENKDIQTEANTFVEITSNPFGNP